MLLTAALLALTLQSGDPTVQDTPTRLEDVVVDGRRLETLTREFVDEVAAPARNRGVARWRAPICVGVINLQRDVAEYIADRVSTVAEDMGLQAGEPGCDPNIVIVATGDGDAFADALVSEYSRRLIVGGSGMDRGRRALDAFRTADAPVRWWHVSAPVDSDTGALAVRLPGFVGSGDTGVSDSVMSYAPQITVRSTSLLNTQIRDDLLKTFVVVDVNRMDQVSLAGLGDYLAFVSLAQVNPEAKPDNYDTILNLFERPEEMQGLTSWDTAYLAGLYATESQRSNQRAQVQSIADSILYKYRDQQAAEQSGQ